MFILSVPFETWGSLPLGYAWAGVLIIGMLVFDWYRS